MLIILSFIFKEVILQVRFLPSTYCSQITYFAKYLVPCLFLYVFVCICIVLYCVVLDSWNNLFYIYKIRIIKFMKCVNLLFKNFTFKILVINQLCVQRRIGRWFDSSRIVRIFLYYCVNMTTR